MSIIATAVKHLLAAGVAGDDLVRAIAEMEAELPSQMDAQAERRRAKDRERKRLRNSAESAENAPPHPPLDKETSPTPPKEINPPLTPRVAAATRGSRLPDGFEVPEDWIRWAMAERHWGKPDAQAEAATFVDHWHAKAGRDAAKLDWEATWRNWVRNSRRAGVVAGGRDAIRI